MSYRFYADGEDVTDQVEFDGGTFKITGTFTASTAWNASMTYTAVDETAADIIDRFAKDLAERFPADG